MDNPETFKVEAQAFLSTHLNTDLPDLQLIGEGAWSRCYAFQHDNQDLVIRFGNYVADFEKDKLAYAHASPDLPVPNVLDIGEAFGGYYAISTRVYGVPLESLNASEWLKVVPSLVSALEALRTADLPAGTGVGSWGADGKAPYKKWSEHLLSVDDDSPERRTHGWRKKLAGSPQGDEVFDWGFKLLKDLVDDSVPRSLVHCDLINRNALMDGGKLSGIFDWGCALYGDHLYELAWFEFWSPWYPDLDMGYLRLELERRWADAGYEPENKDSRLLACYLHIGLDHLAYNAHLEDWPTLAATAERMRALATSEKGN